MHTLVTSFFYVTLGYTITTYENNNNDLHVFFIF